MKQPSFPGGPPSDPQPACPAADEKPCMRYLIPLDGNPSTDLLLRSYYITAFGPACYMSEANMSQGSTFNCFYRSITKACEHAVLIGEVSKNAPYAKGYTCQPVGNGDYTLQIGSDSANKLFIYLKEAPRQTPFIDVNGTPTEINGPYRNLTEPNDLAPGYDFYKKSPDKNGNLVVQHDLILQTNRDAHDDKQIHSDLAGFVYPCDKTDPSTMCVEPDVLQEEFPYDADAAQVHHVVPRNDPRCCAWGTNSNKNAVVISRKLNRYFWYYDPPADEVKWVNKVPAYTP
jgi:hypothetical protein